MRFQSIIRGGIVTPKVVATPLCTLGTMKPRGAPPKLDQPLTRPDGTVTTIFDQIVNDIRVVGYVDKAAARAGIDRTTVFDWLKQGARANTARTKDPRVRLTPYQERCLAFSLAVDQAEAEALSEGMGLMLRVARGTNRTTTTTKTDKDGKTLEITTKVEETGTDSRALIWLLEHRWPDLLGPRSRIELTGLGGGPVELSAESPGERLDRVLTEMLDREAALEAVVVVEAVVEE